MTDPATHVHRARLYKLASLAFDRPTDEVKDALASGSFADQLVESAAAIGDDDLRTHAETVARHVPDDEAGLEELYSRWASLFGFEQGGEIQLYQIEYAPGTLVTSTDTLADLSGFYGAFGLSLTDGNRERVDHLAIELEFVSHLALQTAGLQQDGDETGVDVVTNAQADFLEDHLGRWVPRFRETVTDETDATFYRTLAELIVALVETDVDRFGIEPDVFEETPPAPLESFTDDGDGDFRCGTCGSNPSPPQTQSGTQAGSSGRQSGEHSEPPAPPRGDRSGPY